MDLQLAGKKALVSGSTAGIGLAIATALAGEGAGVVIAGRNKQKLLSDCTWLYGLVGFLRTGR